ncbi:AI-2E family transporter [Acetobacterium fimetarium]|uniref:AI-2E family transporter n=1 Tax=Acetobacterium fimetarium TaxID=52691 RepID=A0ABR6WY64_9FIRM|nr:AI-2E family transporter [Acetobacterium fimetarium]MBC3805578.1 AI-2E family transporter [Acetobacterium fimetarium]
MKLKIDKELIKKYSYFLVGVLILLFIYKILDNFGIIANTFLKSIGAFFIVIEPIIFGGVLAYFLFRPMRSVETFIFKMIPKSQNRSRIVRMSAISIVYIITIVLIVLFFYATIPSVTNSLTALIEKIPENLDIINAFLNNSLLQGGATQDILAGLKHTVAGLQNITPTDIMNQISAYFGTNPESLSDIGSVALVFVKGTVEFIVSFFIVFFICLYLMLDEEKIIEQVDRLAKAVMNKTLYNGTHWACITIDDIFYKYFTGKILISILVALLYYLGLLIIGVDYAPLFAVILGIANMIPYFGPIIGGTTSVLITLIDDPIKALWVGIWVIVLFQLEGNVLAPNVLGKIVKLNPFWILVSVVIGGSLFGVMGMFIAIPMFAIIKVFLEEGLTRWELHKEKLALENPPEDSEI